MTTPPKLTLTRPDDWHVHFRDAAMMQAVVPHTARSFARAIVMPNLVPPVTTAPAAAAYRRRIIEAALGPSGEPDADRPFLPLMTCYLTDACDAIAIARNVPKKKAGWHQVRIHMRGELPTVLADSGGDVVAIVMPLRHTLHAEAVQVALRMAHDDALAYDAETAATAAAEAA